MPGLTRDEIESVDGSRQVEDVLAMPRHLEDALWRVESAGLERTFGRLGDLAHLLVCGMGGSAIGGDLARAALGDRLTKPMTTVRGYELPPWVTPGSVVLCASYSGNTEETLACYEAAGALGAMRVVVTTGGKLGEGAREDGVPVIPIPAGLQPRAAVAYMIVSALEVARSRASPRACAPRSTPPLRASSASSPTGGRTRTRTASPSVWPSASTAHASAPTEPGPPCPSRPAGRLSSTRTQRSRRSPASCPKPTTTRSWAGRTPHPFASFLAIFLQDADQHPRVRQRIELTASLIEDQAAGTLPHRERGVQSGSSACCPSCCSATSSRSTSRCCAAPIPPRSRRSTG